MDHHQAFDQCNNEVKGLMMVHVAWYSYQNNKGVLKKGFIYKKRKASSAVIPNIQGIFFPRLSIRKQTQGVRE